METKTGTRDLKYKLCAYLRLVKSGETIIITERRMPIGHIVPIGQIIQDQLFALREAGLTAWNSKKLHQIYPVAKTKSNRSVAGLFLEGRA